MNGLTASDYPATSVGESPSKTGERSPGTIVRSLVRSNGFFIIPLLFIAACWFFYLAWTNPVPTSEHSNSAVGALGFYETTPTGKDCPCYLLYLARIETKEIISFVYVDQDIRKIVKNLKTHLDKKVVTVTWDQPDAGVKRVLSIRDERGQYLQFSQVADGVILGNTRSIGIGSILLLFAVAAVVDYFSRSTKVPLSTDS